MILIYLLDGTNVYGARGGKFEEIGSVCCKIMFLGWHFLFTGSYTSAVDA